MTDKLQPQPRTTSFSHTRSWLYYDEMWNEEPISLSLLLTPQAWTGQLVHSTSHDEVIYDYGILKRFLPVVATFSHFWPTLCLLLVNANQISISMAMASKVIGSFAILPRNLFPLLFWTFVTHMWQKWHMWQVFSSFFGVKSKYMSNGTSAVYQRLVLE